MNDMQAQPATMTATIQIKRAQTGKVEEHKLVLTPLPEPKQEPEKAKEQN